MYCLWSSVQTNQAGQSNFSRPSRGRRRVATSRGSRRETELDAQTPQQTRLRHLYAARNEVHEQASGPHVDGSPEQHAIPDSRGSVPRQQLAYQQAILRNRGNVEKPRRQQADVHDSTCSGEGRTRRL